MYVNNLTENGLFCHTEEVSSYLFFDIETTGLKKESSLIYMISCGCSNGDGSWNITQWMACSPDEEADILREFIAFSSNFPGFCHYNGDRFDIPFTKYRMKLHNFPDIFQDKMSLDLYRKLKPCQNFLKLSGMKQKDVESFLSVNRHDSITGRDGIAVCKSFWKSKDMELAAPLLLHNLEDVTGLIRITSALSYVQLLEGKYEISALEHQDNCLYIELSLSLALPRLFSYCCGPLYITGADNLVKLQLQLYQGCLRNYYENYKDYYFLPEEDTALHKSVAAYVDKAHRIKADREHCYTKFPCTSDFLADRGTVKTYLNKLLPVLLK